jgi:hypothetical protein
MSVPGSDALSHPTHFPRIDSIPIAGPQSHGVPLDFNIDPVVGGGVTKLYDNATDYNSGFNAVNRGLSHPYLINNSRKFADGDPYYHEALCFLHRIRKVNTSNPNVVPSEHHMLSVTQLNVWLKSTEGRRCYGENKTAHTLKEEWRFAGSVKRPSANQRAFHREDAVPIVFGGRARIADIGRAYVPEKGTKNRPRRGVPSQRDHLFFLYRRYNIKKELDASLASALGSSSSSSSSSASKDSSGVPYHYWQVEVWLNVNAHAPHTCLYCDETSEDEVDHYVGDYIHVGWIGFVYGDRRFVLEDAAKARAVLRGEDGYQEQLVTLQAVEVFMGVH